MRVVVTGATGNVGSSLLRTLARADEVGSVLGIARRRPALEVAKVEWAQADVTAAELEPLFRGADAVVHLAWAIQPSRDLGELERINVGGSRRVFDAAARAGVQGLVVASSVGAYSRGPKSGLVDESWPVDGVPTSFYSRHKSAVERQLDAFEREHPEIRVVRLRPGLIFKRSSAAEIRRLFAGPFLPGSLLRRGLIRVVPDIDGLRVQAVHADDVAEAYREALRRDVRGAFNIAADPVLDPAVLARELGARRVRISPAKARAAVSALWRLHLQPTPPGWLDLALAVPLIDTSRARAELGWRPRNTSLEALAELVDGLRSGAGDATPPLEADAGGPLRLREVATRLGRRSGV